MQGDIRGPLVKKINMVTSDQTNFSNLTPGNIKSTSHASTVDMNNSTFGGISAKMQQTNPRPPESGLTLHQRESHPLNQVNLNVDLSQVNSKTKFGLE